MTAYWIALYTQIIDQDKVTAYAEIAGPVLKAAGGVYLARGLPAEVYEEGASTRTVVVEFPSVQAARAAYDSPGYQEALRVLDHSAVRDLRIVPGVD